MEVTYKVHILDDSYRYLEVDSVDNEGYEYLLLAEETNPSNICIRKIVIKDDNNQYYERLNTKEFHKIFDMIIEKNKNLFE
jgi:hypothetical protein